MTTAKERWTTLDAQRSAVLRRAWRCSDVTIPGLLPRPGHNDSTPLPTPYQSLGARGVNNLASKLLLSLMPPGTSCFRLSIAPNVKASLGKLLESTVTKLADIEMNVTMDMEASNQRSILFETLRHIIVVGNAMLYMPKSGGMKMYRLDQFVLVRDGMGNPVEAYIKECLSPATLDDVTLALAERRADDDADVEIYTGIKWSGGRCSYYQELNGKKIPASMGDHPADRTPWIPVGWTRMANENYSRSMAMEYLGDLLSLESLSQSIVEFAEIAAKIILLLHPNASTDSDDLANAQSGDVITGNKADIDVLQLEKFADFQVAKSQADKLEQRISYAFLLQSGTVRDAERVTAEEIRALAQELEDVLGGVYSTLAQELQLPIVRRKLYIMQQAGQVPILSKGGISPIITTGFAALGRNHAVNKLRGWLADLTNTFGPQTVELWVDTGEAAQELGNGWGVDNLGNLIRTQDEVNQLVAQRQQQQAAMTAIPHVASQLAKNATDTPTQPAT